MGRRCFAGTIVIAGSLIAGVLWACGPNTPPLIVHEWGTFTSLQDEQGSAIGAILSDDEPVPEFVHDLVPSLVRGPKPRETRVKGIYVTPELRAQVTMRLETPVIYFYPSAPAKAPGSLNISATFLGGWLTQFYPNAETKVHDTTGLQNLSSRSSSSLTWRNIELGANFPLPETKDTVWLAPREVAATSVRVRTYQGKLTQSEKYLFYRGVAHLDSPLRVTKIDQQGRIALHAQPDELKNGISDSSFAKAWVVDIQPSGKIAYREAQVGQESSQHFEPDQYSTENFAVLKSSMQEALVAQGLFVDEARAMLNAWELSYFKNPGLRVFYIVPRTWTERVLPLTIDQRSLLTRVMIGRVELISDRQRDALNNFFEAVTQSPKSFKTNGYFESLGRFGEAIVRHDSRGKNSKKVEEFFRFKGLL